MGMYATLGGSAASQRTKITPVVVFMAFSIEAYLNSIGTRVAPFWDIIERIAWRQKVEVLHSLAGTRPNWGEEPLRFVTELFRLRDRLAHGKPEQVRSGPYSSATEVNAALRSELEEPRWYRDLDRAWATSAKEKFRTAMLYLGALHGFHESDHLLSSTASIEHEADA